MRRINAYSGSLFLAAVGLVLTGCQSSPLSQQLRPQSLVNSETPIATNERAASAAETPIRKSAAKRNSEHQSSSLVSSAEQLNRGTISANDPSGHSSVIPASHNETSNSVPATPAIYAVNQAVPKVIMPPQIYPTGTIAAHAASHGRGIQQPAAAHSSGCGGACCNRNSGYSPVYPQFDSQANGNCFSTNACSDSCPIPYQPRHIDPQEYVYDGGDRGTQAMLRKDLSIVGLDSEDTVMRYETTNGQTQLLAGCRVPIYSPRFASTRKIAPIGQRDQVVSTSAALREQRPGGMQDALPPTKVSDRRGPQGENNVKVIEAYRERNRGVPVATVLPAIPISDAFKPFEDFQLVRSGRLDETQRVLLKRGTAAAMAWSSIDQLQVIINNQSATIIESGIQPAELFNYELGGNRVRLCKVASHQVAEPGDTIDFTIRFDNTGDQPITNIMIQDSLSPRLEYVEDSQKSNMKTDFNSEGNDAGSKTLTWKILEPVKPGSGGFLRFQVKVR